MFELLSLFSIISAKEEIFCLNYSIILLAEIIITMHTKLASWFIYTLNALVQVTEAVPPVYLNVAFFFQETYESCNDGYWSIEF
jgi:hypothetical protein